MKRLFFVVALSLVMVACNEVNDDDKLVGWDKIVADINAIDLPVLDVLASLQDNEVWQCRTAYAYRLDKATGKVDEIVHYEDFEMFIYGATYPYLRYTENHLLEYYKYSIKDSQYGETYPYPEAREAYEVIENENGNLILGYDNSPCVRLEIIAYDENQIVFDRYYVGDIEYVVSPETIPYEYLYKRFWYQRVTDETKWWEKAESWWKNDDEKDVEK